MSCLFQRAGAALCALLASAFLSPAVASPGAAAPDTRVVVVRFCVEEQDPERIEAALTTPLEELLRSLPGVASLNSNTTHGAVAFELHFKGGATEDDRASVTQALDRHGAGVVSGPDRRSVRLDSPRAEELLFSLADCREARR